MKINEIENEIVLHLQNAVGRAFAVEPFPADLGKYLESFRHPSGVLLVQYVETKRTYKTPISGMKKMTFEVSAVSKNLRALAAHQGVYGMLDTAFEALSGVTFTALNIRGFRMFAVSEEYQAFHAKNGLWVYTQTYESDDMPFIKQIEETDALLNRITLDSFEEIIVESEGA